MISLPWLKGALVSLCAVPRIDYFVSSFQESSRYLSPTQISDFLDGAIRNRISVRLIGEQHIALSHALNTPEANGVGIVDKTCSPSTMINMCGSFVKELCQATLGSSPIIVVNGDVDATFPCVPSNVSLSWTDFDLVMSLFISNISSLKFSRILFAQQ